MSDIKPIETRYAGCRFRSRLEARWARFFDALGIKWLYEPQGFEVGEKGRPYLPDFQLPDLNAWVEVKGHRDELDLRLLAEAVSGPCGPFLLVLGPVPLVRRGSMPVHTVLMPAADLRPEFGASSDTITKFITALGKLDADDQVAVNRMVYAQTGKVLMTHAYFYKLTPHAAFAPTGFQQGMWSPGDPLNPPADELIVPTTAVADAYEAARSARFEHGEEG